MITKAMINDLRGVIRIAKAASVGTTGNAPRIQRAEQALERVERMEEVRQDALHDLNRCLTHKLPATVEEYIRAVVNALESTP